MWVFTNNTRPPSGVRLQIYRSPLQRRSGLKINSYRIWGLFCWFARERAREPILTFNTKVNTDARTKAPCVCVYTFTFLQLMHIGNRRAEWYNGGRRKIETKVMMKGLFWQHSHTEKSFPFQLKNASTWPFSVVIDSMVYRQWKVLLPLANNYKKIPLPSTIFLCLHFSSNILSKIIQYRFFIYASGVLQASI